MTRARVDLPIWVRLHYGDPGPRGREYQAGRTVTVAGVAWPPVSRRPHPARPDDHG